MRSREGTATWTRVTLPRSLGALASSFRYLSFRDKGQTIETILTICRFNSPRLTNSGYLVPRMSNPSWNMSDFSRKKISVEPHLNN